MKVQKGALPKVLVADDQPINVKVLADLLREWCDLRVATNGRKVLELVERERPDLILLDVMMPEVDGFEVCRRLKEDPATAAIPIIFITARSDSADEAHGLELGAVDYITKPFQPPIVRARVRNHLALLRKVALLEKLAFIDGLTEIPNRRYFTDALERAWGQAARDQTPLGLLMVDVDFFKKVNDTHGHAAGDECLKQVAGALFAELQRPGDLVARLGGEEFAVLLPGSDEAGSHAVAERLRAAIEALAIPLPFSSGAPLRVTASVGCGTVLPAVGSTPEAFVDAVDARLYAAKQGGRNRVA